MPAVPEDQQDQLECKHCGEFFIGRQNLGGHISKKHPGMSPAYLKKIATRQKNEILRKQRLAAKALFAKHFKQPCHTKLRTYQTQLTKILVSSTQDRVKDVDREINNLFEKYRHALSRL